MFRVGDVVYAIGDRCSHAEASLAEGEIFDGEVECPRHGSAFDLATGMPQTLPATRPVPLLCSARLRRVCSTASSWPVSAWATPLPLSV